MASLRDVTTQTALLVFGLYLSDHGVRISFLKALTKRQGENIFLYLKYKIYIHSFQFVLVKHFYNYTWLYHNYT